MSVTRIGNFRVHRSFCSSSQSPCRKAPSLGATLRAALALRQHPCGRVRVGRCVAGACQGTLFPSPTVQRLSADVSLSSAQRLLHPMLQREPLSSFNLRKGFFSRCRQRTLFPTPTAQRLSADVSLLRQSRTGLCCSRPWKTPAAGT